MDDRDVIRQRTREAAHLQLIEGNPLDAEDFAMLDMFEREEFSPEDEIAFIHADIEKRMREKNAPVSAVALKR